MGEKFIKSVIATVRGISEKDMEHMEYGIIPKMAVGDKVEFSMHITDGFICIEIKNVNQEPVVGLIDSMQLFNNLPEFFESYDTNTRFVLMEKIDNNKYEIGHLVP